MGKRIFWSCVLLLAIVGGVYAYRQWKTNKQDTDGAVVCTSGCDTPEEKQRFARENSGDTSDGNSEHKTRTASQEASAIAAGFPSGTGPVSSNDPAQPGQLQPGQGYGNNQVVPNVVPAGQTDANGGYATSNNSTNANSMNSMTNNAPQNQMGMRQPAMATVGMPLMDSRSPNAPNGMAFAGTGNYQWYRQGNLTWRIDTGTGHSCIIYATMEEWRNQLVLSHGCGRSA